MKPHVLLRLSAVFVAVFAVGHTVGMLNAGKAGEPAEAAAITAMQAYHFVMMGSPRTARPGRWPPPALRRRSTR